MLSVITAHNFVQLNIVNSVLLLVLYIDGAYTKFCNDDKC